MARCCREIDYLATKQTYEMVREYVEKELKETKLTGEEWNEFYEVLQVMYEDAKSKMEDALAKLEDFAYNWDRDDLIKKYFEVK